MTKKLAALLALLVMLSLAGCRPGKDTPEATTLPQETTLPPETTVPEELYIRVFREGMEDQIPVERVYGNGYSMAMDPEYFTFLPGADRDTFSYEGWYEPGAVYYSVRPIDDAEAARFIDDTLEREQDNWFSTDCVTDTLGGYPARCVILSGQKNDPACCMHIFLVESPAGFYVIETRFVTEMYEGLYAIIRACLDTFTPQ